MCHCWGIFGAHPNETVASPVPAIIIFGGLAPAEQGLQGLNKVWFGAEKVGESGVEHGIPPQTGRGIRPLPNQAHSPHRPRPLPLSLSTAQWLPWPVVLLLAREGPHRGKQRQGMQTCSVVGTKSRLCLKARGGASTS